MPYGSMPIPMGWNGLSMLTEACSVCILIVIINFKVRGVEQDSVPFMMKVILIHIPIKYGVVYPNIYRLFNSSH